MALSISPESLSVLFFLAFAVYSVIRFFTPTSLRTPPGPRPDLFIGNLRQMPLEDQEKTFAQWSEQYGDVVYAQVFGKSLVVLNSVQAARDLLEKRSLNYSDRPRFVLLTELMGWDSVITHMRYGDRFRKHRRLIQEQLHRNAIPAFRSLQEQESIILLQGLLKAPNLFMQHLRRFAASSILKITYGHTVTSTNDPLVRAAEEVTTATVEAGSPGSTLVDIFPPLKYLPAWLPGAGFKRRALNIRRALQKMLDTPFLDVQGQMASGTAMPSFTSSLLERHESKGIMTFEDEQDIKGAAGVLYSAASDTTMCVLATFVLAMVLHPDVYRKAQAEIDRVIGNDRLPNLDDRHSLPYLKCVLMEVYRWHCAVPLCIPHRNMEDDVYRGYHIPKGSMIIPNIWAMTQDADIYPQAELFLPERFMGRDGKPDLTHEPDFIFGFGRRICPGKDLAEVNLWLAISGITAALDILKSRDGWGQEIEPPASFISGFVSHPKPFTCDIRPRSESLRRLILQTHIGTEL